MNKPTTLREEKLARLFHNLYETLAPAYGYETRPDTKEFDPESKNGKLMIAVCKEVLISHNTELLRKIEKIDVSGGGSGRRLKEQVINLINQEK